MKRNNSIDVMRGLVMILMPLDHIRDLLHITSLSQSPTDLTTTTPALFFTRWITHLCAPTFVFLSGTSAFLSMSAKNDLANTRRFLVSRGIWLVVLEFTLVNFGIWFDPNFNILIFEVIAAIGTGFLILSALLRLPPRMVGLIGGMIVVLHQLVSLIPASENVFLRGLMSLFSPIAFPYGTGKLVLIAYPPIPWLGIMLIGYGAGYFFESTENGQRQIFRKIGLLFLGLFMALRVVNLYGDPSHWSAQKTTLYTFLSFINVTKYPPSLQFCLLFLGIMFLILSWVQGLKNRWTDRVSVYGKTPLFYFLVHWYLIHPLVFAMVFLQGFKRSELVFGSNFGRPKTGSGVELWAIYLIWVVIVLTMYPLCQWYGNYKMRHKEQTWLRYI
ncbi:MULTISPECIES: heparan-alpha-glucosaminide N-acetyltransferase domain-containing protein [unclassified Spirosoma]|uniref:DUF1624 domain-containing protein n=1 Tax=unclassified Spirosoma TaxID=2621999 RepID=UPI00095A2CE6|nr:MULTISPECIES: heparan-alpha-glucosaminide N-acetyltransferase domain-containing protein [unclassified Spirosoma]MBN8824996.1 DUF1624 domain-containing protein [Spirosoma sp.]OJW73290.1 MAG: hypothetical protein BGO59_07380 [Spirosoma sp. 48-14]